MKATVIRLIITIMVASNPGHFGSKLVLGSLRFDGGNVNDNATNQ